MPSITSALQSGQSRINNAQSVRLLFLKYDLRPSKDTKEYPTIILKLPSQLHTLRSLRKAICRSE